MIVLHPAEVAPIGGSLAGANLSSPPPGESFAGTNLRSSPEGESLADTNLRSPPLGESFAGTNLRSPPPGESLAGTNLRSPPPGESLAGANLRSPVASPNEILSRYLVAFAAVHVHDWRGAGADDALLLHFHHLHPRLHICFLVHYFLIKFNVSSV